MPEANPFSPTRMIKMAPRDVIRDSVVPGLTLRCDSVGKHKTFYLYYRMPDGRERRPKLGRFGILTVNDARRLARTMLLAVAEGRDPSDELMQKHRSPKMADLIATYRLAQSTKSRSAHAIECQETLFKRLTKELGKIKTIALDAADVQEMHDRISKTAPIQANRAVECLSSILTYAEKPTVRLRPVGSNPCKLVEQNPESKRRRYMVPGAEAEAIGAALRKRLGGKDHESALFLYLLILTGARKDEIGMAKTEDLIGNSLIVRHHKTEKSMGDKIVHFPDAAIDMLIDPFRPVRKGRSERPGFLVGIRNPRKVWAAVCKEAKCTDLRMHDLRHTFASFGLGAGVNLSLIGGLLGHSTAETTKRYAHLLDGPAKAAANKIADEVSAALLGGSNGTA